MSPGNSNQDKMLQGNTQYAVTHIMGPILGPLFYFSFEGCCVIFLKKKCSQVCNLVLPGLSEPECLFSCYRYGIISFGSRVFNHQKPTCQGSWKYSIFFPFIFFFLFCKRFLCFPGPCYRFLRHVQSVFLHACGCLNGGIILKGKSQTKDLEIRAQRETQPHEWNGPHPAKSPKSYPRFPWATCV